MSGIYAYRELTDYCLRGESVEGENPVNESSCVYDEICGYRLGSRVGVVYGDHVPLTLFALNRHVYLWSSANAAVDGEERAIYRNGAFCHSVYRYCCIHCSSCVLETRLCDWKCWVTETVSQNAFARLSHTYGQALRLPPQGFVLCKCLKLESECSTLAVLSTA